jgi:hypothetical protein
MKLSCFFVALITLSPYVCAQSPTRARRAPASDAPSAPTAPAQSLPLKRVVLYSNGVAYFERRGNVSGHAEIDLPFKQSQVDDVLKSLVVLDLGQGSIGAVSYNSSAPSSARLAEIPFSIEAQTGSDGAGGLEAVLKQLQGARVSVATASRSATGSVLTVEERTSKADPKDHRIVTRAVVIASDTGELIDFDLSEVRSIRLLDEDTRRDITEFTDASASARRRDAKTIAVTSDGKDQREMLVSYTVASPIWKTTYRVVLDASGKPFFQGWAIVDNVSDEDWSNISLTLVSGTPVSFIQPIQQPLYRYRPIVPIPSDLNLEPQVYEPGEPGSGGGSSSGPGSASGVGSGSAGGIASLSSGVLAAEPPAPPPAPHAKKTPAGNPVAGKPGAVFADEAEAPKPTVSELLTGEESGVTAAASGSEVGELFQYHIDKPITVSRGHSALIPILQTTMEGERVSIYNQSVRTDRPMGGLRLKNTSSLTLEGGSLSVIDGDSYAGEALIERLKPGEERFISYALDLGTLVRSATKEDREPVFYVKVINGVFQAHYYRIEKKDYTLINQTDKPRTVFVEHPVRAGWALTADTAKPYEKTASVYRFKVELGPHETVSLQVNEKQGLMDTYALSNLTRSDLDLFISRHYIDQPTQAALDKILDIKTQMATLASRVEQIDSDLEEISTDQGRLRENIKALKDTAEARELIARYVSKAGQQETSIEKLRTDKKSATDQQEQLQIQLTQAIRSLALDRKIQ